MGLRWNKDRIVITRLSHGWTTFSSSHRWPVLVLLVLAAFLLLYNLGVYPKVWFDEGYKLNAARTLALQGVYGTTTVHGLNPFDPGISSGPADIVPIALVYRGFGVGVVQARLVPVIYTLMLVVGLYLLAVRLFGRPDGFVAALLVLVAPTLQEVGLVIIGRQVLGEAPALALIVLGLLVWNRTWERPNVGLSLAAGVLFGLGLLSKTQVAIALLPALGLTALLLGGWKIGRLARETIPLLMALGIVLLWSWVGQAAAGPITQQANASALADAVRTNLVTGLWGSTLYPTSWLICAILLAAVGASVFRLWKARQLRAEPAWQVEFFLVSFVAIYAVWFALFSVGWSRYAYAGLVMAELLLAGVALRVFTALRIPAALRPLAVGLACGGLFLVQTAAIVLPQGSNDAAQAAALIDESIPDDAVIETWEWELSGLSDHAYFHHPDQAYLFEAIRQFSHQNTGFNLRYDALQADPDYLVIGAFGGWTGIYPPAVVEANFELAYSVGDYQIFKRIKN